jgi:hypothetical protein
VILADLQEIGYRNEQSNGCRTTSMCASYDGPYQPTHYKLHRRQLQGCCATTGTKTSYFITKWFSLCYSVTSYMYVDFLVPAVQPSKYW